MSIMNIYNNNVKYFIYIKNNNLFYKLPVDIIKKIYSNKNIDINKLNNTYLFFLSLGMITLGMITYNRYIL